MGNSMIYMLDVRTLVFMTALITAVLMGIMMYVSVTHKTYPGFYYWTISYAFWSVAAGLLAFSSEISGLLSVTVMYVLRVTGFLILAAGLRRFYNRKASRLNAAMYLAMVVGMVYATYFNDDIRLHSLIVGLVLGVMTLVTSITILTSNTSGMRIATLFTGVSLILISANELVRAARSITSSVTGTYFSPDVVAALGTDVYQVIALILYIVLTCSLILLASERLAAELRTAQSELRVFAHTDELTGVSNARQFISTAERVMRQSLANRTPMALVILDVDYFKEINDSYGHYTGDAVLKRIVTACEAVLRKSDLIARMGGDEFAVLLPNTGTEQVALVIKRLTAAVAQLSLVEYGVSSHLSISAGSALLADDDTDINALMRRADRAMYRVKVLTHRSRAA